MKLTNATPGGATVFITDMKVRIGSSSIPVRAQDAIASADLRSALDQGLVILEVSDREKIDPRVEGLLLFAELSDAKREGRLLFAQMEGSLMGNQPVTSRDIPVRPAVFEKVV